MTTRSFFVVAARCGMELAAWLATTFAVAETAWLTNVAGVVERVARVMTDCMMPSQSLNASACSRIWIMRALARICQEPSGSHARSRGQRVNIAQDSHGNWPLVLPPMAHHRAAVKAQHAADARRR